MDAPAPAHAIPADNLAALPGAPGVYLFFGSGAETQLPLYIGKSINIRTRVLSHIPEPAEAQMMRQVQRVDWVRTAGEIGALLLESALIKSRYPLYNQRLRRSRELCAWQLPETTAPHPAPRLVYSRDVDFATAAGLHGLYTSARAAQKALRELAEEHRLCLQTLGLEAPSARGCFGRQIGRCAGVCVGHEPADAHFERLRAALRDSQVQQWPFPGPVAIVEREGDWCQRHIVHHWRHLGTLDSHGHWPGTGGLEVLANLAASAPSPTDVGSSAQARAQRTSPTQAPAPATGLDLDAYRILMRPLIAGTAEVVRMGSPHTPGACSSIKNWLWLWAGNCPLN